MSQPQMRQQVKRRPVAGGLASLGVIRRGAGRAARQCLLGLLLGFGRASWLAAQDESVLFQDLARVVGASRMDQSTVEAAASITIITASDLARHDYRTLGDALEGSAGLVQYNDRNYTSLGVRGFAVPADFTPRILFLLNGHPLNNSVEGGAYVGNDSPIDLDVIDRIEVIRGPGSALYGTGAFFGVVNVVTKPARQLSGFRARADRASSGVYQARMSYGARFKDVDLYLAGSGFNSSGVGHCYELLAGGSQCQDGRNDREAAGRGYLRLSAGSLTLDAGYVRRRKFVPTGSYGTVFGDPRQQTLDGTGFVSLAFQRQTGDNGSWQARLGFNEYRYSGEYPYDEGLLTDGEAGRGFVMSVQRAVRPGARHQLLIGMDSRLHIAQHLWSGSEARPREFLDVRRSGVEVGVFAQDEFRPVRSLLLTAGARFDRYPTFGGTVTPRAAAVWTPKPSLAVKLLYGRAFRAPSTYELFYGDGISQKAALLLEPERIETAELATDLLVATGVRLSGSLYRQGLRQLIGVDLDPSDSLLVTANRGRAKAMGMELRGEVRLATGMIGRVSYAHQSLKAPSEEGQLANAPTDLLAAEWGARFAGDRVSSNLLWRYVSGQTTLTGDRAPAYHLADVAVQARLSGRLTARLAVRNALDRAYATPGGSEQQIRLVPQDRRTLQVGADLRF